MTRRAFWVKSGSGNGPYATSALSKMPGPRVGKADFDIGIKFIEEAEASRY
ncbi:MAG: hypothetical protein HY716_02755 [Planctomycetes bacterium]|nr:hypothetical protein [Planctomycetota bacterium]